MTILLTGKNGQVGWELQRTLAPLGEVVAVDYPEVDFTDASSLRDMVRQVKPALIVNPAAYTAVDKAESEPDLAHAVNAIAPAVLAEEAKRLGAPIIHYSTDYVFDGGKVTPYKEEDKPNPLNVYGKTKLEGELAVRNSGAHHAVFRLSWVYGTRGKNFLLTMLRLAKERNEIRVVNDQFGAPTWCRLIAEVTAQVTRQCFCSGEWPDDVYHLTAGGETTWYDFTRTIFAHAQITDSVKVLPITTSEYPTAAIRPVHSVLSNKKLQKDFRLNQVDWQNHLDLALVF